MTVALVAIFAWAVVGSAVLCWYYRSTLIRLWREPVLAEPVLVIESDDWGPGQKHHARALRRLMATLAKHRDNTGAQAVMTLGMLLAIPDGEEICKSGLKIYSRLTLDDARFAEILRALKEGERLGVFSLQLHGMEHCWPPAVLVSMRHDSRLQRWIAASPLPDPTELPPELQSRWTDASSLPSKPLRSDEIDVAAVEEVGAFRRIFGRKPVVAVPPTFVWTDTVERAWVAAGVRIVVTPGTQLGHRDSNGHPVATGEPRYNAERGKSGALYAVRNGYFEPKFGHTADDALAVIEKNSRKSRPTLFETHRFNFTDSSCADDGFRQLSQLLAEAMRRFPGLRFMSTEILIDRMAAADPSLVDDRWGQKLRAWLQRVKDVSRFRKLAWVTGLGMILWLLEHLLATAGPSSTRTPAAKVAAR